MRPRRDFVDEIIDAAVPHLCDGDHVVVIRRDNGTLSVKPRSFSSRRVAVTQATQVFGKTNGTAVGYAVARTGESFVVWIGTHTRLRKAIRIDGLASCSR